MLRLLRSHLRPYRRWLLAVLVFQAIQASASLLLPSLNADIIDKGVLRGDTGHIWSIGATMIAVTAVQGLFSVAAVYCGSKAAMSFGRDVRAALFHRVTEFSAREVNLFGAPSLITRITNDVQQVQMLVLMSCTMVVAAPLTVVFGVFMAMRQDLGMSWLLAVSLPLLMVILGVIISRMVPQFRLMQERLDNINAVLRGQIVGMRVVRAFVREPVEVERFHTVNEDLTQTSLRAGRLMALMFPTMMLVVNASSIAVIWFGGHRINSGAMSIGSLVAFLTYLSLIMMAVMMATMVAMMAPRAAVSAERIQEVLDTFSSVVPPAAPITDLESKGRLDLRDVGFRYPGAEHAVLEGISFTALPGQTTAIIGSTGSGKTSLVNLAARLFDVTAGAVLFDGVDIRQLDPDILWQRIGLVPQKPYLFAGSVASNLRYGKPDATDEEIWTALEVAQAADFVRAMPGGLDANIAQGGINVSGGQRQRLAMARALVRKPEVYLFDDSFSALDLATDARLRAALGPYTKDASVIIIAQRFSTIMHADQILVLEGGETVGLGTHEQLLATCPTYAEIVESQVGEGTAA
ncbi:ABC transporter ATP-binding protein [Candidatus Amarobacter glycogenicus]|uniref:ABC transporter ATP-binding protein n=1 Tax=Candidatus Amarobacter glycogenicus TaxID=3140699 RepID=UPI0031363C2C|nr:ABC transporter ATP-binding protein [Dehalococcoidia bacterium]MBK8559344.1 ABC transporter ATP-binding protein [Dehalococcoidia bacterium]